MNVFPGILGLSTGKACLLSPEIARNNWRVRTPAEKNTGASRESPGQSRKSGTPRTYTTPLYACCSCALLPPRTARATKHTGLACSEFCRKAGGFRGKAGGQHAWYGGTGDIIALAMVFLVPLCLVFSVCAHPTRSLSSSPWSPMFAFVTFQVLWCASSTRRTFQTARPHARCHCDFAGAHAAYGLGVGGLLFSDPNIISRHCSWYSVPIAVTSTMWIGIYAGDMSLALGTCSSRRSSRP